MTTKRVASTLVLSIVLIGAPSLARSQRGGMAGMSHMDMGHEIGGWRLENTHTGESLEGYLSP